MPAALSTSAIKTLNKLAGQSELTKSEEVELLEAFRNAVPQHSYLRDYLQGCVPHFESQVRNDMVTPVYQAYNEMQAEILVETSRLKELREQVRQAEERLRDAKREANYTLARVQDMAKLASEITDKARMIEYSAQKLAKEQAASA